MWSETAVKLFILALIIFLIGECGYFLYHLWQKKQELSILLDEDAIKEASFSVEELQLIKERAMHETSASVDDITWKDTDMDVLYQRMNTCLSSAGDQCLYHMLRNPVLDQTEIVRRKQMMKLLQEKEQWRYFAFHLLSDQGTRQVSD